MTKKEDNEKTWKIILGLSLLYSGKCYVCHRNCKKGKGFTIHHIKYKKGELIHSDFKNRLEYYQYLEPIVRREPERFALLCNTHHQSVTRIMRFSKDKLVRLIKLVRKSY